MTNSHDFCTQLCCHFSCGVTTCGVNYFGQVCVTISCLTRWQHCLLGLQCLVDCPGVPVCHLGTGLAVGL